jgi:hypothetical protein
MQAELLAVRIADDMSCWLDTMREQQVCAQLGFMRRCSELLFDFGNHIQHIQMRGWQLPQQHLLLPHSQDVPVKRTSAVW